MIWVAVALLGGLGALARFTLDGIVSERLGGFPWGTLVVNVTGSFALGVLAGATLDDDATLLAGTATIGAYTTFSTWVFEMHRQAEDGRRSAMAFNLAGSLGLGLGAVALGRAIGRGL
ncbi:MAG: fluoride efflux transporter CrcB [Thermoleophilaceae bacterium]